MDKIHELEAKLNYMISLEEEKVIRMQAAAHQ
jgi:hypothetical protein